MNKFIIFILLSFNVLTLSSQNLICYTNWNNTSVTKVTGKAYKNTEIVLTDFCMPTTSRKVTSNYGVRWGRMHQGIDVKVYIGDTIRNAFDGKVRIASYDAKGYGYYVVVRHDNGIETLYAHLSKCCVKPNEVIKKGHTVGLGGNTGRSTGSHLHFECRILGTTINPSEIFDFYMQDITSDFYKIKNDILKQ